MQPDTQREGPAYRLGQGTTQDQPRGEGKQIQAGGSRQTPNKQDTSKRAQPHRGAQHKGRNTKRHKSGSLTPTASRTQEGRARKGTRQRNKDEGRKRQHDQVEAVPESRKRTGGPQEQEPRQGEKGAPHNSRWEQVILWRPREEGKVKQASKPKRGRRTEKRGDRYV